tara:strand:- start:10256 stop:10951 length:696 start_codon:yes stop_codon:yes gene_type:complete
MKIVLSIIVTILFFNQVFSQDPITISGSCSDSNALGVYNYQDTANGKPRYVKIINEPADCSEIRNAVECTRAFTRYYSIEWSGTDWEWKEVYGGDGCEWSRRRCVDAVSTGSTTTLSSNTSDTSLPSCEGWSGSCIPTFSECTTLSLINNSLEKKFAYYPNPTKNKFNIKFEEPYESLNLSLTNALGQVLMNKTYYNSQLIELNINQPSGIYFIKLTTENNKEAYIKLIKK